MRCIICGKECEPSLEHIVCESLGNKEFVTSKLCKDCNNLLGAKVDCYFTDHIFLKMIRETEGIKSKSGKPVHALAGNITSDDGDIYRFTYPSIGQMVPKLIPVPKDTETGFHIKVDSSNPDAGLSIARQKLMRMTKPDGKRFTQEDVKRIIENAKFGPTEDKQIRITLNADIDKSLYSLTFIKIAYEYACEALGDEYYDDPKAKQLRRFLDITIHSDRKSTGTLVSWNELKNNVKLFSNDILQEIYLEYAHFFPKKIRHMILLAAIAEDKAICQIMLFGKPLTSATVLLSDNARLLTNLKRQRALITIIFEDGTAWSI